MPSLRLLAALLFFLVALAPPGAALAQTQVLPPPQPVPLDSVVDVSALPEPSAAAAADGTASPAKPHLSPAGPALQHWKQLLQATPGVVPPAPGVVDDTAPEAATVAPLAPNVTLQFDGISNSDQGFAAIPPDDNLGVGPNHVFQMVNITGRISSKAGVTLQTFTLNSFFQVTSGFSESDPHVIYDLISNRWLAVYLEFSQTLSVSSLILMVSQTSDATGLYCRYRLGNPANAANPNRETFLQDFPMLGVSNDKIVVSYNGFNFPLTSDVFAGAGYYVVNKADALGCVAQGSLRVTRVAPNLAKSSPWPSHNQGSTTKVYLAQNNGPTLSVFTVDGVPGVSTVTETTATVGIRLWTNPPDAQQLGSAILLMTNDARVLSNAWQASSLWLTGNEACTPVGDLTTRSCLRMIEFRTDTLSIRQDMTFAGAPGEYFFFPAARPDGSNNLHVVFTSSSAAAYAGVRVTGRLATDPLNTLQASSLIKPGGGAQQSSSRRFGDYAGAAIDPSDLTKVWVIGEYIQFTSNSAWGTWVARLTFVPPPAMNIDTPANGATVSAASFLVAGWAIDPAAPTGTGVDAVHVFATPTGGGAAIFLGVASYGGSRPDIGAIFGARFTDSGFGLVVTGLAPGSYTLQAFAHSTATATFNNVKSITIIVASGARMNIDTPANGASPFQPFVIAGWAIDIDDPVGTGVDAVHVYAVPTGGAAIFLGVASYGGSRPDIGALFGAQFTNSGFGLVVNGLAPGSYQLLVFAHSLVTGTFNQVRAVNVIVAASGVMSLDTPANGAITPQPFVAAGWAIDLASTSGPGIDAVHVWAVPVGGGAATFLGVASYGAARPDVAAIFGAQFLNSGFGIVVAGLPPGAYSLQVFVHSAVTATFNNARAVTVTIP
jgi:hypothetical protein